MVKCCLYKLVGRQKLCYFERLSVLSDIQNTVNSRPLTYPYSGYAALDVISPNTFICPRYRSAVFINSGQSFFEGTPPFRCNLLNYLERRDLFLQRCRNLWHEE